jgi:hypothetical protein
VSTLKKKRVGGMFGRVKLLPFSSDKLMGAAVVEVVVFCVDGDGMSARWTENEVMLMVGFGTASRRSNLTNLSRNLMLSKVSQV